MYKRVLCSSMMRWWGVFVIGLSCVADGRSAHGEEVLECRVIVPEGQRVGYVPELWPDGLIPYIFDDNVNDTRRQDALDAMRMLESVCNVRFVPRSDEADYIRYRFGLENSSPVGHLGGEQVVTVFNSTRFVIAHELMHTLGVTHEQQRPNRNQYVQVNAANFDPACNAECQETNWGVETGTLNTPTPYDFDSIMHYGQCPASVCPNCPNPNPAACCTMTVLAPYQRWQPRMGQRAALSTGDAYGLITRHRA